MEQENANPKPQEQQSAEQPVRQPEQQPENSQQAQQQPVEPKKPIEVPAFLQKKPGQPPVTGEEKLWAIVCYIPFMAIIALIIKPDSKYIKLHGRQGLLLSIIFFISIFIYILPSIGPLIGGLLHFAIFMTSIFSMYQSAIGNWWKIPVIGDLAELIPADLFSKTAREAIMGPESNIGKTPEATAEQTEAVQTEEAQTEAVQTEEAQTEAVQTEEAQIEAVQTEEAQQSEEQNKPAEPIVKEPEATEQPKTEGSLDEEK